MTVSFTESRNTRRGNAYGKGEDVISDNLQLIMVQSQYASAGTTSCILSFDLYQASKIHNTLFIHSLHVLIIKFFSKNVFWSKSSEIFIEQQQ